MDKVSIVIGQRVRHRQSVATADHERDDRGDASALTK